MDLNTNSEHLKWMSFNTGVNSSELLEFIINCEKTLNWETLNGFYCERLFMKDLWK
jgi:hypothetical protein